MNVVTVTKERPILFSGPMVRAILEGRKTQTRRIINPQPETYMGESGIQFEYPGWHGSLGAEKFATYCRHGQRGDHLYVKETFYDRADYAAIGALRGDRIVYAADGFKAGWKKHPSIFMPRWASRITLEITGVRVEELRAISEEDAKAEGAPWMSDDSGNCGWHAGEPIPPHSTYSYRNWFRHFWDQINGSRNGCDWASNPWVWVVSFRRLES